jgi:CPA2 family monovalent cation:H+ antiporter-2
MLGIIVATLFISLVANIVLKKFGLPTLIGYIFTGTIISYIFGLHTAVDNHVLKEIAEFGIVFLMFTIGLEFSIKHLKDMKYEVFVIGSLQILLTTFVLFFVAFYLFHLNKEAALIVSMAMAMSSTAIILKTFNESGEISKKYGKNALGILIMQDIAVIPILIIIGVMSSADSNLEDIILNVFIGIVILMAALYIVGKYLLERFFNQIVKTKSDELFIGSILFLAIGASLGAHILGFSYSLGAFVAGMLIAETKYKHQAEADLIPFRDILLGIFFITVGMQINFALIYEYVHLIFILLVTIMSIKFFIIYTLIKIGKSNNKRTSLKTAFSLIQVGEFALAILELVRAHSLIPSLHGQILIVTIVISMILTPFILKNLSRLSDFFIKEEFSDIETIFMSEPIQEHLVVLGYGEFGQAVVEKLKTDAQVYIIIENNIDQYRIAQKNNEPVLFGSASNKEILKRAFIEKAKKVIVAIDNPKKLEIVCHNLEQMLLSDKIIVKVHSEKERNALRNMGLHNIIVENEISVKELEHYI